MELMSLRFKWNISWPSLLTLQYPFNRKLTPCVILHLSLGRTNKSPNMYEGHKVHHFVFTVGIGIMILPHIGCSTSCPSLDAEEEGYKSLSNGQDCFYYFSAVKSNWYEAQMFCQRRRMQSAIIRDYQTSNLLKSDSIGNAWLAGRSFPLEGWTFVNGQDADRFINPSNETQCVTMSWKRHKGEILFSTIPCYKPKKFFCRLEQGCTVLSTTIVGWFKARTICQENGGDLLYLKPGEDQEYLQNVINSGLVRDTGTAFVGIQHKKWMWLHRDGTKEEIGYTDWDLSQPANSGECVHLMYYDQWGSGNCGDMKSVLCMKPLFQEVTTISVNNDTQDAMEKNVPQELPVDRDHSTTIKPESRHENTNSEDISTTATSGGGVHRQAPCKDNDAVNGILLSIAIGSSVLMLGLLAFIICRGQSRPSKKRRNESSMKLREVSSWVEEDECLSKPANSELTMPVAVQAKIKTPVYETVEELNCDAIKQMKDEKQPKHTNNYYNDPCNNALYDNYPGHIPPCKPRLILESNDYDYDEIDEDSAQGPRSPFRQNRQCLDSNHHQNNIKYSQVNKPKRSIDDGETILIENNIYG